MVLGLMRQVRGSPEMARYVANRLAQAIMLLVIVSAIGFAILHLAPGGPLSQFAASAQMTQEDLDRVTRQLGLDRPLPIQYLDWFGRMLRGDWGTSYRDGEAVLSVISSHLGATLELMATATIIAVLLGCWIGVLGALRRYSLFDTLATVGAMIALSIPTFWFGLVTIYVFSVKLGWLPAGNRQTVGDGSFLDLLHHLIAPALVLALVETAMWGRFMRSSMLEVINQDYIRTARAKGMPEWRILTRARAAQRAAADDHGGRPPVSDAARRRAGRRDRVHLARHGPAVPRFHRLPRLSRGDGHPDVLGDHGADRLAARRHPLCRRRSAHPGGLGNDGCRPSRPLSSRPARPHGGASAGIGLRLRVLSIILVLVLGSAFGPYLLPFDDTYIDIMKRFAPPLSGAHILGTDELGRDVLARLMMGGRDLALDRLRRDGDRDGGRHRRRRLRRLLWRRGRRGPDAAASMPCCAFRRSSCCWRWPRSPNPA